MTKKIAITGATGLVGSNLAICLIEAGHEVHCTRRPHSKIAHLSEYPIHWVEADLNDTISLRHAFHGMDAVFHCAALTEIWPTATPSLIRTNVEGTQHVIQAVKACEVARLVHCSSVVAVGLSENGQPCDEMANWNFEHYGLNDGYAITKRDSEQLVHTATQQGLDAVIVNPTYMFGPYDARPSSGSMILEVLKGGIPGYTTGYNNFSDVRDVCQGMIAAWERGKTGERYILGGENMTYQQIFQLIARVAGVKPPRHRIPAPLAHLVGFFGGINQTLTGKEQRLNRMTVRYGLTNRFQFSSAKAQRELGYQISPLEGAIGEAIEWFREQGMV